MIFNSLGSNYDFQFVLKSLFSLNKNKYGQDLKSLLNSKYKGETVLVYKAREAIKLNLKLLNLPKGSKVGINGFTCYVVYQAIKEAGHEPVYLDIEEESLNFSTKSLSKHKNLKVVIIQNTLGNPSDIVKISEYCKLNEIFLIEDLAHSVGTVYSNNKDAGLFGDFVVLSFGQDKIIDSVSGGALVIRNSEFTKSLSTLKYKNPPIKIQIKDRFYPSITFLIRSLYGVGLGKALHFTLNKLGILSQAVSTAGSIEFHNLPSWYSKLAYTRFIALDHDLSRRRKIANIYSKNILKKVLSKEIINNVSKSSNLRFPIFVEDRNSLIEYLKRNGVYVSDIWYDAPISPKRFLKLTNYSGECPVSEEVSRKILNLPTHINVTENDAEYISNKINKWLNTK